MQEGALTDDTRRYQLGDCIGRGGLGSVYRAWDMRLGRWVAIKRLTVDPTLGADEVEEKMRREANALAALQHPNVVTVHDFGTDEDGPFVVMELIEGQTLDALVAQAPFDYASFRELAIQSLGGIGAAHRAGLLHRDLKPGNVMLVIAPDGSFQVKLLDFGLAKFAPTPMAQTLDQSNTLLGTIPFMAPEQFSRGALDARTDLYALGCVFYYTLTGRHPFDGDSVAEIMASHLQHRVPDLAPLRPDLPAAVSTWVMRLLSLAPADRPASTDEALGSLRGATSGVPLAEDVPSAERPVTPNAAKPRRARPFALAALAVLLVLLGGGAYLFSRAGSARPAAGGGGVPSISLFANVPVAHARGRLPGSFTIVRSGGPEGDLVVEYLVHGSAKNGVDYAAIPKSMTIKAGATEAKIAIVPLRDNPGGLEDRHVKLTLIPEPAYRVATPEEVKLKIVYDK